MATQLSKSAFVAPILIATPNPCKISAEESPTKCKPTTFSLAPWVINLYDTGDFSVNMAYLGFRETDGPGFRVGEHHRWDVFVVLLLVFVDFWTEQSVGQFSTSSDGNWRQLDTANNVTQRVDVLLCGVLVFVDDNLVAGVDFDTNVLKTQAEEGSSTDSPDHLVHNDGLTSVQIDLLGAVF
ncbi:hypothetical protein WICPIJ_000088 [Wickerhamomyces pijperi]|uniref:Uncharacterized protein n=1 Tax=Wickerhamomyces pijperi TaxID=599730 RepID=A0A9P8QHP9_WICPI|nr:hypothetical protein WICPIJ_000088 [Wickerhamomyces pijperi]